MALSAGGEGEDGSAALTVPVEHVAKENAYYKHANRYGVALFRVPYPHSRAHARTCHWFLHANRELRKHLRAAMAANDNLKKEAKSRGTTARQLHEDNAQLRNELHNIKVTHSHGGTPIAHAAGP